MVVATCMTNNIFSEKIKVKKVPFIASAREKLQGAYASNNVGDFVMKYSSRDQFFFHNIFSCLVACSWVTAKVGDFYRMLAIQQCFLKIASLVQVKNCMCSCSFTFLLMSFLL